MRLGDVIQSFIDRMPAAREVKREATETKAATDRAIMVRQLVERQLGISFQHADGQYAHEAREGRRQRLR